MSKQNTAPAAHRQTPHKKHHAWKWILGIVLAFLLVCGALIGKFYYDAKKSVDTTYQAVKHNTGRSQAVDLAKGKPFSVLLLGTDTGELGRTDRGRSDTIMVATISPKKTTLLSIPRDTLVSIAGQSGNQKINAAYAYGGLTGSLNTLQSYLDIPIDHYVEVNMKGLEQLSEAIGPVDVKNDLDFTQDGNHFPEGTVTIDHNNILPFSRMRHEDPRGDYGRQLRQRLVVTALVNKIVSVGSITKYQSILKAISSNMKTDISFDQMKQLYSHYKGATDVSQIQLKGQGQMIDGVSYEVVSDQALSKVQQELKQQLEIK